MTLKWRRGVETFALVLCLGAIFRAAILWFAQGNEDQFFNAERLGLLLVIAFFAGLGSGVRA